MKNIQYSRYSDLRDYLNVCQLYLLPLESVLFIQKYKSYGKWFPCTCRSIPSEGVHQISWESNKKQGSYSRRRLHICKWVFLLVPSLAFWFRNTLPLIMQKIKDKNKIGLF